MNNMFKVAAELGETNAEARDMLIKHAQRSESAQRIDAMVRLARAKMTIRADRLDADPWLFNVSNGTLDLRTQELRPHSPADRLTKLAPVAYDPHATAPSWTGFLERILPSAEIREFVQRAIGYALTGDVGEQVLFFFHGSGANGKSTMLTALQAVLGDYAMPGAPDLLLAKHGESHPAEVADLQGARLVVCQEIESGRSLAEARVKQLTGGDVIKARFMRQDFFAFKPTHKIIIGANHKPRVRGQDHAIWRRLRLVPFNVTIPPEERDRRLVEKLATEAPGILRWAVEGCAKWQRDGLGAPAEVTQATDEYQEDQDHLGPWLDERCERVAASEFEFSADLYRSYVTWCDANGERPWQQRAFGEGLAERGFRADRARRDGKRGRAYFGLRLRAPRRGSHGDCEARMKLS